MLLGYVSSSLKKHRSKCGNIYSRRINTFLPIFLCVPPRTDTTIPCRRQPSLHTQLKSHKKSIKKEEKGSFYHPNTPVELLSKQRNPALVGCERSVLSQVSEPWWCSQCPAQNRAGASLRSAGKGRDSYGKPEGVRKAELQLQKVGKTWKILSHLALMKCGPEMLGGTGWLPRSPCEDENYFILKKKPILF